MRKLFVLALPLLLAGCADLASALAPPYIPEPIHIYEPAQYASDVSECLAAGAAYKPHFSISTALSKTVAGATADTSLVPLSPLVPLYGAAGGAASATADGMDIMSGQHANVARNCLRDMTRRDRSAIVADPRN